MAVGSVVTAAEAACALGNDLESCVTRINRGEPGLLPLGQLWGQAAEYAELLAGWIPDRRIFLGRRYGMTSNAAVHVSRVAVRRAGWTAAEIKEAWLFVGSSRGNAAEAFGGAGERRPIKLFRASNLMHSEIAAAVSIELGIRGPWQVLSNGCASGLDALGFACLAIESKAAPRALVVSVDLPLVPELLLAFRASGVLSRNQVNDPYSPNTTGFLPGEAAVAVTMERLPKDRGWCSVEGYAASSDAFDPIGLPEDGRGMAECMRQTLRNSGATKLAGVCPHATGTKSHAIAEIAALEATLSPSAPTPCMLIKPFTGHTLGASGLLDVALLAAFLKQGKRLPNLPGLTGGSPALEMKAPASLKPAARIMKLSVGMGGHNASVILRAPALRQATQ